MESEYPFDEVGMEHFHTHADRSSNEENYESPSLQSWSFDQLEGENDTDRRTSETKSAVEVRNRFPNLNVQRRQALFRSTKTQNCPNVVTPTLEEKKQLLYKLRHFGGTARKLHNNTTTTNIHRNQIQKLEPITTIKNEHEDQEDCPSPSDVRETIRIFGGAGKMRKLTAVQLRRMEIEQKTKEVEERNNADPKTDFKSSWKSPTNSQKQAHGQYKKTLRHVKGVRSKRTLQDLP